MATFLKYLRYASFAISIILILRMLRSYRKVRSVSRKSCAVAIVFPIATLLVYSIIIGSSLPSIVLSALFAFGLALGVWQGKKTDVWVENGRPRARNTIWFLVVWALSYTLMQVLVQLGNSLSLNVGIGTMCVSTAIALGSQGFIMIRLSQTGGLPVRLASIRAEGGVAAGSGAVPAAGAAEASRNLPTSVSAASASPHEHRYCSVCGAQIVPGDHFCRTCRAVIR